MEKERGKKFLRRVMFSIKKKGNYFTISVH